MSHGSRRRVTTVCSVRLCECELRHQITCAPLILRFSSVLAAAVCRLATSSGCTAPLSCRGLRRSRFLTVNGPPGSSHSSRPSPYDREMSTMTTSRGPPRSSATRDRRQRSICTLKPVVAVGGGVDTHTSWIFSQCRPDDCCPTYVSVFTCRGWSRSSGTSFVAYRALYRSGHQKSFRFSRAPCGFRS